VLRVIARMNVGGPTIQVCGLMRGLPPNLFEQRLLTGFCSPDEIDYIDTQAPDINVTRITGLGRAIRPLDDFRAFVQLVRDIRDFQPHIVHTHTTKAGVLGRLAARLSGVPVSVVHTYHGHLLHGYFGALGTRLLVVSERTLECLSDHLVAVGTQVRVDLLAAGIGNRTAFSVINPGIKLDESPGRLNAARQLGLDPAKRYLSFIGRVTRIKRPDRWAPIAQSISEVHPETEFLVVGNGDEVDNVRRQVSQAKLPFHFMGNRSDIPTILALSEGVILTSDNEGTPICLIEAGMAGVPVVATDVGSVAEVVQQGSTGWLTGTEPSDIAHAAIELLGDPLESRKRGDQARYFTGDTFGFDRFIRSHAELYLGLAERPSAN